MHVQGYCAGEDLHTLLPPCVSKTRERECTQATEHKDLECVPHPTSGVQEQAGSGLGRRSDWSNEISQHTKCLSRPIRIPSCLP